MLLIFDPIELENPEDDWYYNNDDNFDIPEDYEPTEADETSGAVGYIVASSKNKKRPIVNQESEVIEEQVIEPEPVDDEFSELEIST